MKKKLSGLVLFILVFAALFTLMADSWENLRQPCHWTRCGKRTLPDGKIDIFNCEPEETGIAWELTQVVKETTAGAVIWECGE